MTSFFICGLKSGRLTAKSFAGYSKGHAMWNCICECGKEITTRGASLRSGAVKSCGCLRSARKFPSEFSSWKKMRERCNDPKNNEYHRYGARGITVCDRWNHAWGGFANFLADMGTKPTPKHTIDRVLSNGNYTPTNCKWSTHQEQQNNRRNNRRIARDGKTQTLAEWCREIGINRSSFYKRLKRGMTQEQAVSQ